MPKVPLTEVNAMIEKGNEIRESFKGVLPDFCTKQGDPLGVRYTSNDFNAFVFSKDEILRFFSNDLKNRRGEHVDPATHLIVVIGAQVSSGIVGTQHFQPGDLTVISAGVNKLDENNYTCLDIDDPGNEHTPRFTITKLDVPMGSNQTLLFNFR